MSEGRSAPKGKTKRRNRRIAKIYAAGATTEEEANDMNNNGVHRGPAENVLIVNEEPPCWHNIQHQLAV